MEVKHSTYSNSSIFSKMLIKGKKGQGWEVKLISLIGSMGVFVFGVIMLINPLIQDYFVVTGFSLSELTYDIKATRIITAPECLAYQDDNNFVHAGIIDLEKFTKSNILSCLTKDGSAKFKLTLTEQDGTSTIRWTAEKLKSEPQIYVVNYWENNILKTGTLEVIL